MSEHPRDEQSQSPPHSTGTSADTSAAGPAPAWSRWLRPRLPRPDDLRDVGLLAAQGPGVGAEVMGLWADLLQVQAGISHIEPHPRDKRFADPAWRTNSVYRMWAQSYLAWCAMAERLGQRLDASDYRHAEALKLASGIVTSALAPTNYLWGNPAAMKRALETGGKSLVQGMTHWAEDLVHNGGMPSMVKKGAFTVGENLALTPGAVVARDPVAELIQYQPTTPKVYQRATLVIPPPIGRYYFLDLAPQRSFVEYAVAQELQVFMLSWRNPDAHQADWSVETYGERILRALDEVRAITGQKQVNLIGFCAGGILESVVLNALAARGDNAVGAASFAVTLLDWSGKNPMSAFNSEASLEMAAGASRQQGVFASRLMGNAFTWLRPNDLVWNYWVNNYLMGQDPPEFDILAWNADGTRLPAELHRQFIDIFSASPLAEKDVRTYLGEPFDASRISVPVFVQGAVTDHLTPWRGTYRTTELVGSKDITYVLSNAGHIASLVNPPTNPKASYMTGPAAGDVDATTWQQQAEPVSGSWWTAWAAWSAGKSGRKVNAPAELGGVGYEVLGPAPGKYVRDEM